MEEVLPVASGVVLGFLLAYLVPGRLRAPILGIGSVLIGAAASWITGELAASWLYLLLDVGQVLTAAALTAVLAGRWRTRAVAANRGA